MSCFSRCYSSRYRVGTGGFCRGNRHFNGLFTMVGVVYIFKVPVKLFVLSFTERINLAITLTDYMVLKVVLVVLPFPARGVVSGFGVRGTMGVAEVVNNTMVFLKILVLLLTLLVGF